MEKKILEFLQKCTECGLCQRVCPFLEKYGLPSNIVREKSEKVFFCTNCGACNLVCKEGAKPGDALYALKYSLIHQNGSSAKKILQAANSFAQRGHSFPFSHWEKKEIIFWPGCSLSGTSPSLVKTVLNYLEGKYSRRNVGLILDCCFDPLYQNGSLIKVEEVWREFNKKFQFYKIKKVILGCTNCYKLFKSFAKGIEVRHILEEFSEDDFVHITKHSLLHLPCPAFREREIADLVINKFKTEVDDYMRLPACCGAGGACYLDEELSYAFLKKILEKAKDRVVLTFCMGCKNRFLKAGLRAHHLLETLSFTKPSYKAVSSFRKWTNRLLLSLSRKLFRVKSLTILLFLALIFISFYLQKKGLIQEVFLKQYLEPYASHPLSMFLYLLIYTLAPSLFISSLGLTLTAGFLWGPLKGTLLALLGATFGATFSFLLSRYFFKDIIRDKLGYEKWQYLKQLTDKHGWKALAFARLVPFFPYPVINYLFGLMPLSIKTYFVVTFLFMAPAGFAYSYLGFSLREIFIKGNLFPLLIVLLFFLGLIFLISFLRKRWNL
ncbi:MAG: VTT domain-containing protein [Caldimicrobium sp.]